MATTRTPEAQVAYDEVHATFEVEKNGSIPTLKMSLGYLQGCLKVARQFSLCDDILYYEAEVDRFITEYGM